MSTSARVELLPCGWVCVMGRVWVWVMGVYLMSTSVRVELLPCGRVCVWVGCGWGWGCLLDVHLSEGGVAALSICVWVGRAGVWAVFT